MSDISSFHQLKALDNKKQEIDFANLKGKVVLVVNVASQCGFTPQYKGLQETYAKYHEKGLEVIGFPCNQFGGQEPGTNEEVVSFCKKNYGVDFQIMDKIDVNGANEHQVYTFLKKQKSSLGMQRIKWNFEKFLIDKEGKVVQRYTSLTTPAQIDKDIEKLL